jgi:ssDNA-binding Zn-finger/Zn-ribbon topoisomerase 1
MNYKYSILVWSKANVIEGKCPKCGQQYWGWSLLNQRNQSCKKCGTALLISEDGKKFAEGYSPFSAEEYKLKTPPQTVSGFEKGQLPH